MKQVCLYLLFFTCALAQLRSQDVHTSQPSLAAVQMNPALTGVFHGSMRVAGRYRSQWTSVPVNYRTVGVEADKHLLERETNLVSVGIKLLHDLAGDGQLSRAQGGLTVAVAQKLTDRASLSAGAEFSLSQRSVDLAQLKFKNQWNGEFFDPNAANKEPFGDRTAVFPSVSAGVVLHLGNTETPRNVFDFGLAAHQINRPTISFNDDKTSKAAIRFVTHLSGSFQLNSNFDLVAFSQLQLQGKYNQWQTGTGLRMVLGSDGDFINAIQTTLAYRLGDALIPTIQVDRGPWNIGLSYDINISDFQVATQKRGGWELAGVYRMVPVPKVPEFKACPVF
jgi:type IX secretion system PorP/SprF family membrane protein